MKDLIQAGSVYSSTTGNFCRENVMYVVILDAYITISDELLLILLYAVVLNSFLIYEMIF